MVGQDVGEGSRREYLSKTEWLELMSSSSLVISLVNDLRYYGLDVGYTPENRERANG